VTPTGPYLLRAIYEWIVDNSMTPHLLASVDGSDVVVPEQYVENGLIVLNIAPSAVKDLLMGNESISFSARFGGIPREVHVPVRSIQAIYARENGQGLQLSESTADAQGALESSDRLSEEQSSGVSLPKSPSSHLKLVK